MCLQPIVKSYTIDKVTGKINILWNSKGFLYETGHVITLNCGKCVECLNARNLEWATRICQEASQYERNCVITLTFDDNHLPFEVDPRDVQLFLKRLFKKEKLTGVRRFYCGEYGKKSGRPHYHLILFNYCPTDLDYFFVRDGETYYKSKTISSCWKFGYCLVGHVSFNSAKYCALYMQKQLSEHYDKLGKRKPFIRMSNRPGIGYNFAKNVNYDVDKIYVSGKPYNVPRYYDKINFKDNGDLKFHVKQNRLLRHDSDKNILEREREFYAKLEKYKAISPTYIPYNNNE